MRLPRQCVYIPHNACARGIVQVCSFEWLIIMQKVKTIVLFLFLASALAIGSGAIWLLQNEDKVEAAVLSAFSERLKTNAHIESIHLDIWSSFPRVSLILEDVYVLGSEVRPDTLLKTPHLALECNAWKLMQGQYELQALRLEDAEIKLIQNPQGNWNTDVWKSSGDSLSTSIFAIDELAVTASTVIVNDQQIDIEEALASLAWSGEILNATGVGQINAFNSDDWSTSMPLKWQASCTYDGEAKQMDVSIENAEWLSASWSAQLAYSASNWNIAGHVQGLSVNEVMILVKLPSPWDELKSDALADGKWSWENGAFKSNWQIDPSDWQVPFAGDPAFSMDLNASGKLWLKYENRLWRADLPALRIATKGLQWHGTVSDLLVDKGTFKADGTGQVDWKAWDAMPSPLQWSGKRPQSGTTSWTGTIAATKNKDWIVDGEWTASDWMGAANGTPWKFNGKGEISEDELFAKDWSAEWDASPITGSFVFPEPMEQLRNQTMRLECHVETEHWIFDANKSDSGTPILLEDLRLPSGSDLNIHARIARLQYGLWAMQNAEFHGQLTRDHWSVTGFSATTLSGEMMGDASVAFQSPEKAIVLAHPTFSGCDLHELFFAFENFDQKTLRAEHLTGMFEASGSIQFEWPRDLSWQPKTLDVLGTVSVADGTLKNLEAFDDIADYLTENRMMAPLVDPDDLRNRLRYVELENLESAVYISKETVQLPSVDVRSSAMNISLEGAYGFDESLDYTLGFAMRDLRNTRNDEFGLIEDDGLGQRFFIAMDGTLDEPRYSWDRDAQKDHRRENLQREKELLKTLFRRSSN